MTFRYHVCFIFHQKLEKLKQSKLEKKRKSFQTNPVLDGGDTITNGTTNASNSVLKSLPKTSLEGDLEMCDSSLKAVQECVQRLEIGLDKGALDKSDEESLIDSDDLKAPDDLSGTIYN